MLDYRAAAELSRTQTAKSEGSIGTLIVDDEPLARLRIREALEKISEISGRLTALIDRLAIRTATLERFIVKKGGRILLIRSNEVDWIEAAGNYVEIHAGKAQYLLREALSSLEQQLDADRFRRIHRSTIVNLDRVRELDTVFNGELEVVLQDRTRLPFSRRYRQNLPELGRT